ncbi:hypothetical protein FXO38_13779 [Capsicum annuum]|nr:hypothetical protein FXO38_13779 [Capsicum annuum]
MAQHANRSCSVRENQPKNLLSDEVPSFSFGLTQDEVFNLGSTNVFSKEGVTIEELRYKHRNDPEKIVEIMKRKGLTKTSSPTKFQKLMKRKKSDEKEECSKIASLVASDSESEQEKVEEFALVTGLNCATNKDEFVFDEESPNKIIDQYFDGESFVQKKDLYVVVSDKIWGNDNDEDALKFVNLYLIHAFLLSSVDTVAIPRLHFDLVESDRYSDYPWGSVVFEELARSLHKKLKTKEKFYMLLGMPLAIQIWLYERCSNVPRNVASKVDSQIPRILNWKTNSPRPGYETFMGSMFDDTNDKVVFKNIEPTRKEISAFHIPKKLVPGSASHNEDDIDSDNDFQDSPQRQNQFTTKKNIMAISQLHLSEDEDSVVSKKIFDKFCEKVWQEFNDVRGLVSSRFDQMMNAINENKVGEEMAGYQSNNMSDAYNVIDRKANEKAQSDDEAPMRPLRITELTEGTEVFLGAACIFGAKLLRLKFPEVSPSHLYVVEDIQEDHTFSVQFLACID